jgi:hypothetical protein
LIHLDVSHGFFLRQGRQCDQLLDLI